MNRDMKKRTRGFLLLEALMSLTLLGFAVVALMESFWIAELWMRRGRLSHQTAACLDEQAWLALSHVTIPSRACPEGFALRAQAQPFSLSLVRTKWTVQTTQGERTQESSVEGFGPAI
jgi:type II secretory pathway pseudopilin PulG